MLKVIILKIFIVTEYLLFYDIVLKLLVCSSNVLNTTNNDSTTFKNDRIEACAGKVICPRSHDLWSQVCKGWLLMPAYSLHRIPQSSRRK